MNSVLLFLNKADVTAKNNEIKDIIMSETLQPQHSFTKAEMLRAAMESKEVDQGVIPIIEKFFSMPITPTESCYGHPEEGKTPYFSYSEDDVKSNEDEDFQKSFKEKIAELQVRINNRIGGDVVVVTIETDDYGGGPKNHTVRFQISDKIYFEEHGKQIVDIIWDEFSKYIDGCK